MNPIALPATWLIVLIMGLSQLNEAFYATILPNIAKTFLTLETVAEHTLTIYLFGFAVGILFWGRISDQWGRKPCVIAGLVVFIIGSMGCYFSSSIKMLMVSRFIQAIGSSISSVLGQAICRDVFHGPRLGEIYSITGGSLALFLAFGPICAGFIAQTFGWLNIFFFLAAFAAILIPIVIFRLPETYPSASRKYISTWSIAKALAQDTRVIAFGLIVAGCNGILFSYFAEGAFYLIGGLDLTPNQYALSFVAIASAIMAGGLVSKKLHALYSSKEIMDYGLLIIVLATTFFSFFAIVYHNAYQLSKEIMIIATIASQMLCSFGICIATSNALALALVDYQHAIGAASSFFGFFYCCTIGIFTFLMGLLHNGTLLPMPIYFMFLSFLMLIVNSIFLNPQRLEH